MKTVLLAIDPDSISAAMRHCLKPQTAFQLLEANSIAQLLDRFVEFNGRIDLLVIDTAFDPAVSSIDVALNFRRYFPRLRILLTFSGSSLLCTPRQRTAMGILPTGSLALLRRPFSPQILRLRIEGLLAAVLLKVA
ncbi:hypothetical protein SBA6_460012 [Candidatus Sulfopaludibacter sp. SbA6]|nr:hypothetical protein SBA6_460012 [Candidatus Sulfopaludibacter sp. SbA6]